LYRETVAVNAMKTLYDEIADAARALRAQWRDIPAAVLVGSAVNGLGLEKAECLGPLLFGFLAGLPVAMPAADSSASDATFAVRVAAAVGARALVVVPEVWGLRPEMRPGDWVVFTDHINLSGVNPLTGLDDPRLGPCFLDMSAAYDARLREIAGAVVREPGFAAATHEVVYAATTGSFPGSADDCRVLRGLGADAAGSDGVAEVIVGVQAGLAVLGMAPVAWDAAGNGIHSPGTMEECLGAVVLRI
jgi:purine nucleoside phosphorylase